MKTNQNENKPKPALRRLMAGNHIFTKSDYNPADISRKRAHEVNKNGQTPYAVILSCSDSRVPPEHIFSAGIGELFVIRTAGNVVGETELDSIEFAVQHFQVPLVVIMGHTRCAAVALAFSRVQFPRRSNTNGHMYSFIREIKSGLDGAKTESDALRNHIRHSKQRVLENKTVRFLAETEQLSVICAEYNVVTGHVTIFD